MFSKKITSLFLIFLVFSLMGSYLRMAYAINTTNDGYQFTSGQTRDVVLADASCRRVTNNATFRFVPTRTMGEWNSSNSVAAGIGVGVASCAINGACGGSNNTCNPGSPSGYSAGSCGGYPSWTCNGQYGGSNASCNGPYNGDCCVPYSYLCGSIMCTECACVAWDQDGGCVQQSCWQSPCGDLYCTSGC